MLFQIVAFGDRLVARRSRAKCLVARRSRAGRLRSIRRRGAVDPVDFG